MIEGEVEDGWEVCPDCEGTEGHYEQVEGDGIDYRWVDCATCEGSGGWTRL